jgi:hypothetical protein
MPALTAVELGPDTCVLVRVVLRGGDTRVLGVEILDPAAFPGSDAFVASLKLSRRKMDLPRRARVVLWGLPDGASLRDPAVRARLASLTSAGFRVQRVVSPCNALAALARIRTPRPDGATGWLLVDRTGVAIVVSRPGELLYSHAFNWDSSVGARGSQARMLQRYSLVSYLAPELRRAIAAAREKGGRVDTIITCGNLPELRSLTMPLIEELDLEVETLDSLDGLTVKPEMRDRLRELAPAIRIACAGAATRATRPLTAATEKTNARGVFRAAALLVAVGGVGWWWYSQRAHRQPQAPVVARARTPETQPSRAPQPSPVPPLQQQPVNRTPAPERTPPVRPAENPERTPAVQTPPVQTPPVQADPPKGTARSTRNAPPPAVPQSTIGVRPQSPKVTHGGSLPRQPAAPAPLLDDPLPQISTILAAGERPFAMIGGRVVTVGDHVGQRVVTAIEPRAVVFREPSGVQIRVGLGGRFAGVKRRN